MAALGRVTAPEGTRAMQEINVTVINPWFMTALFGTAVAGMALIVAALVDFTMAFNVPRNNRLARVAAGSAEAEQVWKRYLVEWTAWNTVRTVASLAATAALIGALAAA